MHRPAEFPAGFFVSGQALQSSPYRPQRARPGLIWKGSLLRKPAKPPKGGDRKAATLQRPWRHASRATEEEVQCSRSVNVRRWRWSPAAMTG